MQSDNDQMLWVEKYRPRTVKDCVLPKGIKSYFQSIVDSGEIQNMTLAGGAGCGKTTVAKAICDELDMDVLFVNGSLHGNIDTLRNTILDFASSVSLTGRNKVVLLDEAEYLNASSTQPALRGFIEDFAINCQFVLTCNFKNRIIEPLRSRCPVVDFTFPKDEAVHLQLRMVQRCVEILKEEGVKYNLKVLAELVRKYYPDFRKVLGMLQRYSVIGPINEGILVNDSDANITELVNLLKKQEFGLVRKWVVENSDIDPPTLFRKLYDKLYSELVTDTIPVIIILIAEYQMNSAFVVDQEINTMALLSRIMAEGEFK
jgi:DNA polymerase III delta prime subunit